MEKLVIGALLIWCYVGQAVKADLVFQQLGNFPATSNTAPWHPDTALTEVDADNFYGTTHFGGTNGNGTVFRMTSSGVLTPVFLFNGVNGSSPSGITLGKNGDLFGVTIMPIAPIYGTIFDLKTNGTFKSRQTNGNFTSFCIFSGTNGSAPSGKLVLDDGGNIYGTTRNGGNGFNNSSSTGNGTVFSCTTNGLLAVLCAFSGTNGSEPLAGVQWGKDGNLYGTTLFGGSNYTTVGTGNGTVFKLTTNGVLTTLAFFNGTNGSNPYGGLVQGVDGNFYGTTAYGGINYTNAGTGNGTVFKITTNGDLTTLAFFNGTNGGNPFGGLVQGNDGDFYGTTAFSTVTQPNYGTIFRITTNGIITTLVYLNGTNGLHSYSDFTVGSDGNIYGALDDIKAQQLLDGSSGSFIRLVQQPEISMSIPNGGMVLSWNSFTNGVYRVEHESSLTDSNWLPVATNTAIGNVTTYTNNLIETGQGFYRIALP